MAGRGLVFGVGSPVRSPGGGQVSPLGPLAAKEAGSRCALSPSPPRQSAWVPHFSYCPPLVYLGRSRAPHCTHALGPCGCARLMQGGEQESPGQDGASPHQPGGRLRPSWAHQLRIGSGSASTTLPGPLHPSVPAGPSELLNAWWSSGCAASPLPAASLDPSSCCQQVWLCCIFGGGR